jgi:hypothetical protein
MSNLLKRHEKIQKRQKEYEEREWRRKILENQPSSSNSGTGAGCASLMIGFVLPFLLPYFMYRGYWSDKLLGWIALPILCYIWYFEPGFSSIYLDKLEITELYQIIFISFISFAPFFTVAGLMMFLQYIIKER